jgi:hypothetical protein
MFKNFYHARRNPWGLSLLGVVGAFMAGRLVEKHCVSGSSLLRKLSSCLPFDQTADSDEDARDHKSR